MSAKRWLSSLPVVILAASCGGPASTIESKSAATVGPRPSSSSAVPASSANEDAYLADLPPMAAPKPLTPANVFKIDLTASLLKDGGAGRFSPNQLADFVDALGTDLTVETGPDRVVFGIAVTKDKLDAALEVLSAVVLHPKFDAKEFDKLKARELDRVTQAEKSDGFWLARNALYRELFGPGHPYAEVDANEQTLANVSLADVREFYKKLYVAGNTMVFVAGDVTAAEIAPKLDAALKGISTAAAPKIDYPKPAASTGRHVILATKAGAKQADVFVGMLGLERKDDHWADLALALQALGGGMSARLFRDVREKRSLAYSTSASARELAHGPSMIALYAGTQTPSAPQSVVALLENLGWITGERPIGESELGIARVSQETSFVYRLETIGQVAALAIDKAVLELPGNDVYDYVASYRKTLHDATLSDVNHVAFDVLKAPGVVIAVAGDASLAKPLSHFAAVHVVDPEKGFVTTAQLPFDANASLDVPANSTGK
ncbi:MAG: pitrilysin family protein [Polyangiales bacterium]